MFTKIIYSMIKCLHLIFKFTRITTTFEMSTFIGLWLILCNMTREYAYAKIELLADVRCVSFEKK